MQNYGLQANLQAHPATEWSCEVCDENAGFNWSDLNGEGMCNRCGAPYRLTEADRPSTLKPEWAALAREYWQATRKYIGLGTILIWRDYPECEAGQAAFFSWVEANHPEMMKPSEPA